MSKRVIVNLLVLFFACVLLHTRMGAEIVHQEKSLYRNIVVKEVNNRRCLVFPSGKKDREQTCIDVTQPEKLVFPYTRMVFASLLLNPHPENILIVGLGGGSIPHTLRKLYPEAQITVVEIDSAVLRVAQNYFDFKDSENLKIHIMDARVFIKREMLKKRKYDLIILDAFNGDYIPEHLMTLEFLQEVGAILETHGVLAANTFSSSSLYDHESVTYHKAFGEFYNFQLPVTGNRIVLASAHALPVLSTLKERVKLLKPKLEKYGIHIEKYPRYMRTNRDWDDRKRPLTDQFSPANLLKMD